MINNIRRTEFSWTAPWQIRQAWDAGSCQIWYFCLLSEWNPTASITISWSCFSVLPSTVLLTALCSFMAQLSVSFMSGRDHSLTARQGSFPISIHSDILTLISHHVWVTSAPTYISGTEGRTVQFLTLGKCCLQDGLPNTWRWHCYLSFHLNSCLLQISITVKSWHCSVPHICTTAHLLLCYYSHFIRRCLVIQTD